MEEKLAAAEGNLNNKNKKTDDEKVNLLRSMNILKEEMREKDKDIKQLQEDLKCNEKSDELIEKTLISKWLL